MELVRKLNNSSATIIYSVFLILASCGGGDNAPVVAQLDEHCNYSAYQEIEGSYIGQVRFRTVFDDDHFVAGSECVWQVEMDISTISNSIDSICEIDARIRSVTVVSNVQQCNNTDIVLSLVDPFVTDSQKDNPVWPVNIGAIVNRSSPDQIGVLQGGSLYPVGVYSDIVDIETIYYLFYGNGELTFDAGAVIQPDGYLWSGVLTK